MALVQAFFTTRPPLRAGKAAGLGFSGVLEQAASTASAQQMPTQRSQVVSKGCFT
jgi:hypothetical protein